MPSFVVPHHETRQYSRQGWLIQHHAWALVDFRSFHFLHLKEQNVGYLLLEVGHRLSKVQKRHRCLLQHLLICTSLFLLWFPRRLAFLARGGYQALLILLEFHLIRISSFGFTSLSTPVARKPTHSPMSLNCQRAGTLGSLTIFCPCRRISLLLNWVLLRHTHGHL